MPSNIYRVNQTVKHQVSCLLKPVIIKKDVKPKDEDYYA